MPNARQPPGNRGTWQSASLAPPNTPRRDGASLNAYITDLEAKFHLGLSLRDDTWSPLKSTNQLADKVYGQIKRFFFTRLAELEQAVGRYALKPVSSVQSERLHLLHETIRQIDVESGRSPGSRFGTPVDGKRDVNAGPGPHIANPSQSSSSSASPPATPSSGPFRTARRNQPVPEHAPVPDPGSPTDDDEDFVTPPSPILSSRSAQRRVQASPRFQLGSPATKRLSDSSASGNSPKLTRTSKGKQPSTRPPNPAPPIPAPSLFKKPSLDMARSFQATSMRSSVYASFNTMSSSQQTQPDTAMTSFTSDAYDGDVQYPKLTRTNSTTIGSLDDQEIWSAEAQLQRECARMEVLSQSSQEPAHGSSSTFGSIDEDSMLETSFTVEAEYSIPVPRVGQDPPPVRKPYFEQSPSNEHSPFNRPQRQDQGVDATVQLRSTPPGSAPKRAVSQPPGNLSESHSKLPHYIRDIPDLHLFVDTLPHDLKQFPYFILFICCRLANEYNVSMSDIMHGMDATSVLANPCNFWDCVSLNLKVSDVALTEHQKIWSAAKRNFEGFTFKGRIEYNSNRSDPVFNLKLLPIQPHQSCRFQRKFGSDRFLYLSLPSFDGKTKPSRFTNADLTQIEKQWKAWYGRDHSFLGRKWRAFHLETIKRKAGRLTDDNSDKRIIMFATEGVGIDEPTAIGEFLNWFFPFSKNMRQSFCKAYARLDLGLSRTIPTLVFKPSQIIYVKDKTADGTPEEIRYSDDAIPWPQSYPRDAVMNDGCSLISVTAALLIWQMYRKATGSEEPIPSAFQARIGGAKGVWMVSGEPSSVDPDNPDIWIQISESQVKFKPHEEDQSDTSAYDPHRLTFEYVKHSYKPVPSELHISFVPILVDRGVPQNVIADLMVERLDAERDQLTQILSNPERLYHWVHREGPANSSSESPRWQAAMYQSLPNKIKHLFESGFLPEQEPFFADCLYRFIKKRQLWMESKLRVPLAKSTFVLGVADPIGILAPGEVHMEFSSPFMDELTGGRFRALDNMDILVARQPACRRSDIQKVRAVKCRELSHLIDVVVFPSRGEYPLAGKLQGGDYDGDDFWLCWEQAVVEPFKNAPAPIESPDPAQYGIHQDTRKLSDIMNFQDLSTVDNLLREALEFRMAPSLLGMVTKFLEKQAYKENQVLTDRLDKLCDMHDLLVDASKQGYLFTRADFHRFTRNELRCGNPKIPAYKQAMEDCEDRKEMGEADKAREKDYKHKRENVLDYLYFEIVRTHDVATLKTVKEAYSKELGDDPSIRYPYLQLREHGGAAVRKELDTLIENLKTVERKWLDCFVGDRQITSDQYNRGIDTCYEKYCSILPRQTNHPDIKPWIHPYLRPQYAVWEEIRASAFYTVFPKRHKLVWHVAGEKLAKLKASSYPGSTMVVPRMKAIMKPKPPKVPKPEDDDSDDEFQSALEDWNAGPNTSFPRRADGEQGYY